MRRILSTFVLVLGGLISAKGALASTTLAYDFSLTSISCLRLDGGSCTTDFTAFQVGLEAMRIEVLPSALANGTADLDIFYNLSPFGSYSNDGIASATLALFPAGPYQVLVGPPSVPISSLFLIAKMNLEVGQYLTGYISINNETSDTNMGTLGSTSPFEWSGTARSDFAGSDVVTYAGVWQFSGVVPEPGTLALLATAAAAAAITLRRRKRQEG